MYLTARITTSCRNVDMKYTRLNLLGWALLCQHARDLLWHGAIPQQQPDYLTAEESKALHERFKREVMDILNELLRGYVVVDVQNEYEHDLSIRKGDDVLCAKSKADLVYTVQLNERLITLYVEVSSTRINVVKPWQTILRGVSLYYERRLPVGMIIVSPRKIMYKLLEDSDQDKMLSLIDKYNENYSPSSNLCSLCELINYCPYKVI